MSTENFKSKERENAVKKSQAKKNRRRKKRAAAAFVFILLVALITAAVLSLTVFFKISDIKVSGNLSYTQQEIIDSADISLGKNIFLVSEKTVSQKLMKKLPLVDEVKIKRTLPDKLEIIITETKEEIVFSCGGKYYSANTSGKIIKKYETLPENLILVTISDDAVLIVGERAIFMTEREAELFDLYFDMIKQNGYDVNFVNISDPYNSYMKIEDRLIVKFGSGTYFSNKSAFLKAGIAGVSDKAECVFDLSAWTPENNQPVLTYGDIFEYMY